MIDIKKLLSLGILTIFLLTIFIIPAINADVFNTAVTSANEVIRKDKEISGFNSNEEGIFYPYCNSCLNLVPLYSE